MSYIIPYKDRVRNLANTVLVMLDYNDDFIEHLQNITTEHKIKITNKYRLALSIEILKKAIKLLKAYGM